MDILGEFKADEIVDVKQIKVVPVQMTPLVHKYKLKIHQPKPVIIQYQYIASDFIIDLDDS